jgi:hypothetical protein
MRSGGANGQVTVRTLSALRDLKYTLADAGSNMPDRRHSVLVGTTTTLAIATIFVAARLVSRIAIVRRTSWDDYFIIIGWVCTLFRRHRDFRGRAHAANSSEDLMLTMLPHIVHCLRANRFSCRCDFEGAGPSRC